MGAPGLIMAFPKPLSEAASAIWRAGAVRSGQLSEVHEEVCAFLQ